MRVASRKMIRFLADWEGFKSCPYRDALGIWTRGYGETEGIGPDSRCVTEREARELLERRVNHDFAPAVRPAIDRRLRQCEFDALVSFTYNVGWGALLESTLRRRINSREGRTYRRRKGIYREELPRWTNGGLAGLVKRRAAEVRMACRGDYSGRP